MLEERSFGLRIGSKFSGRRLLGVKLLTRVVEILDVYCVRQRRRHPNCVGFL